MTFRHGCRCQHTYTGARGDRNSRCICPPVPPTPCLAPPHLCAPHDLHPSPCRGHVPSSPSLSPSVGGGHSGPQHQGGGVCPRGASTRSLPSLCAVTQLAQEYLGGERHRVGKHSCYLFVIWYLFFMLLGNGRWGLVGQEGGW